MSEMLVANPEAFLLKLIFAMLRTGAAFVAAPIFSALSVPLQVRIALAAAVGVMVVGVHDFTPPDPLSFAGLMVAMQEVLVGLALGFVLQIAFAAPLLAGEQIAGGAGLGFAAMTDPQNGVSSPVLGQFLMLLMTLIFLTLDGHLVLLEVITRSYETLPLGAAWLDASRLFDIANFGAFVFAAGLMIALPVGMTLVAVNIVLGVLTRTAPQLNIFAVGLPLSVMVAFVALAVAFPVIADLLTGAAEVAIDRLRIVGEG